MSPGLFDEPLAPEPKPTNARAESRAIAAAERHDDELLFWKGKAQLWAVELSDERLKNARLWALVKRARAVARKPR